MLDDHLHDVSDTVYQLLSELGSQVRHPLTVILERDGAYPPFVNLLQQMERARYALATGRARAQLGQGDPRPGALRTTAIDGAEALESYLARLYVDVELRKRFLNNPRAEAEKALLGKNLCDSFEKIDRVGLELAAKSFARKRSRASEPSLRRLR